jgi:hypothetical protein
MKWPAAIHNWAPLPAERVKPASSQPGPSPRNDEPLLRWWPRSTHVEKCFNQNWRERWSRDGSWKRANGPVENRDLWERLFGLATLRGTGNSFKRTLRPYSRILVDSRPRRTHGRSVVCPLAADASTTTTALGHDRGLHEGRERRRRLVRSPARGGLRTDRPAVRLSFGLS